MLENAEDALMVGAIPMPANPSDPLLPFWVLAGPTACGKSSAAQSLARSCPEARFEIVNGDAFQAYRGLEILSAAPSMEDRAIVPHHLYGHVAPTEERDAACHAREARQVIQEILHRGGTPLLVGGSGLYLKAVTHGLAEAPRGDEALRRALELLSLENLASWLERLDPPTAAATNLKNRRYVTRNLEMILLSGTPLSRLREGWAVAEDRAVGRLTGILVLRDRAELHARIARRVSAMFEAGVEQEVAALAGRLSRSAEKAIGVREIQSLLRGDIDQKACREAITVATRQYAKRQMTWFRRETWLRHVVLREGMTEEELGAALTDAAGRPPAAGTGGDADPLPA